MHPQNSKNCLLQQKVWQLNPSKAGLQVTTSEGEIVTLGDQQWQRSN